MKKTTKIIAALSTALLVGGGVLLAQDSDEVKPEWKFSGYLVTGLSTGFTDDGNSTIAFRNVDYVTNRLRLNGSYTYGNVGLKARVDFNSAARNGNKISVSIDSDTKTVNTTTVYGTEYTDYALAMGLVLPQLKYAYGWANLFDDKLEIQAGRLFANEFGANNLGYGMYGSGVSAVVKPIEGLSAGVKFYVGNTFSETITPDSFFYKNVFYGVAYEQDLFSIALGWGREAYGETGDTLISSITVNPIDQVSILWENDVFGLFGCGKDDPLTSKRTLQTNLIIDITPIDALTVELSGYTGLTMGSEFAHNFSFIEGNVSYDVNDDITADVTGGFEVESKGWYVRPGASYTLGKRATVGLHYAYISSSDVLNEGIYGNGISQGSNIELDFVWAF